MQTSTLKGILQAVKNGEVSIDDAVETLKNLPYENLGFARLDHHRALRTGQGEVVYCEGKHVDHIISILKHLQKFSPNVLATRLDQENATQVLKHFPDAVYDPLARCLVLKELSSPQFPGKVLIITAGTADLPVAQEAFLTVRFMGYEAVTLYDVGVAGLHRLLDQWPLIRSADVIIVVAGMEGALASVVGGLVEQPVIAVPTSVGYGAHFNGLATLLAMLNSCSSGVAVVNIDNGFGAASFACSILQLKQKGEKK